MSKMCNFCKKEIGDNDEYWLCTTSKVLREYSKDVCDSCMTSKESLRDKIAMTQVEFYIKIFDWVLRSILVISFIYIIIQIISMAVCR